MDFEKGDFFLKEINHPLRVRVGCRSQEHRPICRVGQAKVHNCSKGKDVPWSSRTGPFKMDLKKGDFFFSKINHPFDG